MGMFSQLAQGVDWSSMGQMILRIAAVLLCLVIHEVSHGLAAYHLGDPTAKQSHRLSLNPLRHLDPFGLIMMIAVGFGWAKPVIIDPRNFRKPRRDDILVSLAGPAANLVTAFLALVVLLVLKSTMGHLSFGVYQVFQLIIIYNINFAIFNLIPLPPLDGSHVLMQLLPPRMAYRYARLERYSFLILIALIMTPVLSMIFIPLQRLIWQIFVLLLMPFF